MVIVTSKVTKVSTLNRIQSEIGPSHVTIYGWPCYVLKLFDCHSPCIALIDIVAIMLCQSHACNRTTWKLDDKAIIVKHTVTDIIVLVVC